MKILLKSSHAIVVLVSTLLFCLSAIAANEIVLTPIKVSAHVYYFHGASGMASVDNKGFMSNSGFVVTDDGVIVFDALGSPALGQAMLTAISKVTPLPVKRVIISHYHADHFYGLQAFKARGIEFVLLREQAIGQWFHCSSDIWLQQMNARVITKLPLNLRASTGPAEWYLVRLN